MQVILELLYHMYQYSIQGYYSLKQTSRSRKYRKARESGEGKNKKKRKEETATINRRKTYLHCNISSWDETNHGGQKENMEWYIHNRRCQIDEKIW